MATLDARFSVKEVKIFEVMVSIALGLLLILPAQASENTASVDRLQNTFSQLDSIYDRVVDSGIVDENYWIGFHFAQDPILTAISQKKRCQIDQDFESVSLKKVTEAIRYEVNTGINLGFSAGDRRRERLSLELAFTLTSLEEQLKSMPLSICSFSQTPDYSDGHTTRLVRSGDQLLFVFEVGYPD